MRRLRPCVCDLDPFVAALITDTATRAQFACPYNVGLRRVKCAYRRVMVKSAITRNNRGWRGVCTGIADTAPHRDLLTRRSPMRQTFVRRSILGLGLGGAVGAVLLGHSRPSYAAPMQFKATLNGASEVPPNTTAGIASVTASFDPATKMLTWNGTYSGPPAIQLLPTSTARPSPARTPGWSYGSRPRAAPSQVLSRARRH